MADAPNTISTLNGLFKVVYADRLEDLVPDFAILQKRVAFSSSEKELGQMYAQPVNLAHESGFTYTGEAGTVGSLNDAKAGVMKEAQVKGSELILRAQLAYKVLSSASKGGQKAFKKATAWKIEDMNNSMRKRLEIAMLYGQSGVGRVSGAPSANVITISEATWAGGIWAGAEGSVLQAFDGVTGSDTEHNTSTDLTITAVDSDARTITVTNDGNVADGDYLFFYGARSASAFNEMAGLHKIITNTGTLFNISASSYSLWKGTAVTSAGQLEFSVIADAVARAANKGLMEKVLCLVSPKAYAVLNSDQAALRVYGAESQKGKNGFESLLFHSANGAIEIVAHPMVKQGDAFLLPESSMLRIGSVDLSFGVPGMDEDFFMFVPAKNAVEVQCVADQAIFLEKPAHAVHISGITYA
jgi:hypothetical protein